MNNLLGIDIGGSFIKYGVLTPYGDILYKNYIRTEASQGSEAILNKIITSIDDLLTRNPKARSVGICLPGIINQDKVLISPNLPDLEGLNIKSELEKHFSINFVFDNDANAAAIAELEIGNGKDLNDFIYITLGTGVGGAVVYDRKIFRGSRGGAGEIGFMAVNSFSKNGGLFSNYRLGTIEDYSGREGILKRMKHLLKNNRSRHLKADSTLDVANISIAASKGDKASITCLSETGKYLGAGIASAINLLDITNIIFGGGISCSGDFFYNSIADAIKQRVMPPHSKYVNIRKAFFNENTGLVGAAIIGSHSRRSNE